MTAPPAPLSGLSPLQRAALTIRQLRGRLDTLERAQTEPVAIVGMGCRFPGGADTPQAYWRVLTQGQDLSGEFPADRWDVAAYYDPDPAAPGKIYTRRGYFLRAVDQFDARFFGLSPREAQRLDPQHRLLLEVSWETLEDAGQAPDALAGSRTGVFVGIGQNDYARLRLNAGAPSLIDTYDGTGTAFCFAAGRLSHLLGLRGPNLAVDTACSSSLVAVHLACQSLRTQECDLALAGGAHLILSPEVTIFLCRARALAADGRCKTFDAAADGYGRGEGCGMILLKRLADAQAAGDTVLAVIRGSAVDHNGPGSGLTVPSGQAQQALLRQALAAARIGPQAPDYLETHGTGTALGDPIEVRSLAAVLGGEVRRAEDPLLIGSVKTNIGHLEAAAGIAGLIKAVLAMQHGTLPASLHLHTPNPAIPWERARLAVTDRNMPWPRRGARRIAGVSSFGISGTNAHVILEEPPPAVPAADAMVRPLHLLTLSAKSEGALREQALRLEHALGGEHLPALADLCFTANAGRAQHPVRLAVPVDDPGALRRHLADFAAGHPAAGLHSGRAGGERPLAWLCTGQGAQYPGMGRQLYDTQPMFRRILDQCDALLSPDLSPSLLEVWFGTETPARLDDTEYTQPALFALEYALAQVWLSWGVRPAAVLGHSVGEYVAACLAGVFGLEDGLRLIAARGRLMQALPPGGLMAAVAADLARVEAVLREDSDRVAVAAVNGPRNTVISGDRAAVERVLGRLAGAGIAAKPLRTSHAFHSPLIEPMLAAFAERAAAVRFARPSLTLISNLTGEPAGEEIATPAYWCRHARAPVQFARGLAALARRGCRTFLELGPAPVLLGMGRQVVADEGAAWLPSLGPGVGDWQQLQDSLARLYVGGAPIDWAGFDRPYARRRVRLPTYPFQRERFWVEGPGHGGPAREEFPADCCYRLEWQPPPVARGVEQAPGRWLILADQTGVGAALAAALEARGHCCRVLGRTAVPGPGPDRLECLEQRLEEFLGRSGPSLLGVVHLWSLDIADTGDEEAEALWWGCGTALALVRILLRSPGAQGGHLWCVTQGAVPATAAEPGFNLLQTPLWGLGRTIALEHPDLWGGLIDLEMGPASAAAAHLAEVLCRPDGEQQVALRGAQRRVPRVVRYTPPTGGALPIRGDATYLVTGGLGFLGLATARWLVRGGARQIILTGRREPAPQALAALAELERLGATVRVVRADIAEPGDLTRLLAQAAAELPPLRGIVHAAGVGDQRPLVDLDLPTLRLALHAKVTGTRLLERLTLGLELDFFVCFSSIAALWGSKGLAHYAAANRFLDVFAHARRARGLPGLTVNWGPWPGGGMVADDALGRLEQMGIGALSAEQNLAALSRLLAGDCRQAAVVQVDWRTFAELYGGRSGGRLFERLADPAPAPEGSAPTPPLAQRLGEAGAGRRQLLVAWLREEVARILGYPPGRLPDPGEGFFQLGMDSLMVMELRSRLAAGLGRDLPAGLVFDYPTIAALAEALLAQAVPAAAEPPAAAVAPPVRDGRHEPIAIVGMACRFPGGAADPDRFWTLLREGRDATGPIPAGRWDPTATRVDPGTVVPQRGGFIDGVDLFDARYFGISPREAVAMDPQHRLLLEVAHAALEQGALPLRGAAGERTGVFVGLTQNDYALLAAAQGIGAYHVTGNAANAAAGRLSYSLGFGGPSLTVDTACSSSLVAVHLACRSLWSGESDRALAAGVNLMLERSSMVAAGLAGMLSPDGRCKSFDARANGYGRGEGCGVVVLKRLADALADGDRIWALIRGTAVNQDGRGSGFTVPNGLAQQAVLRAALADGGVGAQEVGYVEAHGTGTALGDPIEIGALGAVYGARRPPGRPLWVGAVKANIGHLEAAAGIAGLVKTALVLDRGELPPVAALDTPNPDIAWERLGVSPLREHRPWPDGGRRLAGVSAFGVSGTNAHVVLEAAPDPVPAADPLARPLHVLALSGHTPEALRARAAGLAAHLRARPGLAPADLCFTVNGCSAHAYRAAWVLAADTDAAQCLEALAAAPVPADTDAVPERPVVALLFGGEDAAAPGMGRELYATQPVFRAAVDRLAQGLSPLLPGSLVAVLNSTAAHWPADPAWPRVASFAFGLALAELWQAWGLIPDWVAGAGAGDLAAACVAGVFPPETGLQCCIAAARPDGSGAASTVHRPPRCGYVSAVSGAIARAGLADPGDRRDGAGPPPQWEAALATLRREGCTLFLELGPRPVLPDALRAALAAAGVLPGSAPAPSSWTALAECFAALYRQGAAVDPRGFDRGYARRVVAVPAYPFQRRRYWVETAPTAARPGPGAAPPAIGHPLLGQRLHSALAREEREYASSIDLAGLPFLADHRVSGEVLLPSSVYIEMVLAAARDLPGTGAIGVADYEIRQGAVLEPGRGRRLNLVLRPLPAGGYDFRIFGADLAAAAADLSWTLQVSGTVRAVTEPLPPPPPLRALRERLVRERSIADFQRLLVRRGLELGPRFQALARLWAGPGEALGEAVLPDDVGGPGADAFQVHPVLLDACFQTVGAAFESLPTDAVYLQVGIERLVWHRAPGPRVWVHAQARRAAPSPGEPAMADLWLYGHDGDPVAQLLGLRLQPTARPDPGPATGLHYEVQWQALSDSPLRALPDPADLRPALLARLAHGARDPRLAGYGATIAAIEAVCPGLALAGLRALGVRLTPGQRVAAATLMGEAGIPPRHRRLLERLLAMCAEAGWLTREARDWVVGTVPVGGDPHADLARLAAAHPEALAELALLRRVAADLPAVLRGARDPSEVLFPGGDTTLVERLYGDSPLAAAMNSLIAQAIATALADRPGPLRILEIGAGTGSTTRYILPELPAGVTEYVYTDVADRFTNQAAARFQDRAYLHPELLDIERDPQTQGFSGRRFAIVVAANVLHATADLRRTLRHVRQLLAPGGLLVLLEGTRPLRLLDLIFGLTEGWWRFAGDAERPDHPLLSGPRWEALLRESGFDAGTAVSAQDAGLPGLPAQALLLARAAPDPTPAGRWLIFADRGGVGAALADSLRSAGEAVTVLARGADEAVGPAALAGVDDYCRVLQGLDAAAAPLRGLVHLHALDIRLPEDATDAALDAGLQTGCRSALHLAQALPAVWPGRAVPLWLVTRGAVNTGGDGERGTAAGLLQAPLWGLARVLAWEHGELGCRVLDLDPAGAPDVAALGEALGEALRNPAVPGESRLALRGGRCLVPRLRPAPPAGAGAAIVADRTYLVTGGCGALGLRVGGWLVERGARHLVLVGRRGAAPAARDTIRAWEAAGVRVLAVAADVACRERMSALFAELAHDWPPLAGVLHAAGVVVDHLIVDQEWRFFAEVFAPKVHGAWNLHQLTRDLSLDFFVLFSSAVTLLGGAGVANYAAANEYLNALAAYRRARGLPGTAVAWGAWADLGMAKAVGATRTAEWAALGVRTLAAGEALRALAEILGGSPATVGVVAVDWARFCAHPSAAPLGRFLEDVAPVRARPAAAARDAIAAAPPGERRARLLAQVRAEVEAVLGWDGAERLNIRHGFFDLGMDSLQANDLRNRLQTGLGCALPATLTFKFPTVAALAEHLEGVLFGPAAAPPALADDVAPPVREVAPPADPAAAIGAELAELERLLGG